MPSRTIVAIGGGSFGPGRNVARDSFVLSLARRPRPRVAFVGTASGDSDSNTTNFFRAFASLDCDATDLTLFNRRELDLRRFVFGLDILFVGGGNTLSLLAVWRAHGLDQILMDAWDAGIVLCGLSAGMNCWFEQSMTDSFCTGTVQVLGDGLAFLPGSCCPHYDDEPLRAIRYRQAVAAGAIAPGFAVDRAAALVFSGTELSEVVAWADGANAYRVELAGGESSTRALNPRALWRPG